MPLMIGREKSLNLIDEVITTGTVFGIVAQKEADTSEPTESDVYKVGTLAKVIKFSKNTEGHYNVIVEGIERFEFESFESTEPFITAEVTEPMISESEQYASAEIPFLFDTLRETAYDICHSLPEIPKNVLGFIDSVSDPGSLADIVAGNLGESVEEKQTVLETYFVADRIMRALEILGRKHEMLVMSDKINNSVKEEISRNQRELSSSTIKSNQ